MLKYKGEEVDKDWLLEQIREGTLDLLDLDKHLEVERIKRKGKKEIDEPRPLVHEPFNYILKDLSPDQLKGQKLYGCLTWIKQTDGFPCICLGAMLPFDNNMVEIPQECIWMKEEEVVKIIKVRIREEKDEQGAQKSIRTYG